MIDCTSEKKTKQNKTKQNKTGYIKMPTDQGPAVSPYNIPFFSTEDVTERQSTQSQPSLDNITPGVNTYDSNPNRGVIYRMIVDIDNDKLLLEHIERAQTFAGPMNVGSPERIHALLAYAQNLNIKESERDAIYKPTGEIKGGNQIRIASLGECLSKACACRELSAFTQILLAQEGMPTNITVGKQKDRSNKSSRHAWLTTPEEDIIDPTNMSISVGGDEHYYEPDAAKKENFAAPKNTRRFNISEISDQRFSPRWKPRSEEGFFFKSIKPGGDLYEKAMKSLSKKDAEIEEKTKTLQMNRLKVINRLFRKNPILSRLEAEGVFNRDIIMGKNDEDFRDAINELIKMCRWA
ncbi:MAG: hypothetical protein LBD23_06745 [Oscillospiraceae bacterium]|jgi:hypothetical protein|nr:hypothetical protein [Oscillospiraceae bacterium]